MLFRSAEAASAKGKVRYREAALELLQGAGLGGPAAGRAPRAGGLESCAGHRLGVATLAQALWLEAEGAMQSALVEWHERVAQKHWEGPPWLPAKDVNQMLGWAALSLRKGLLKRFRELAASSKASAELSGGEKGNRFFGQHESALGGGRAFW